MKKKSLSVIFNIFLLLIWQFTAILINAPYIFPSPVAVVKKIWELREPLFMVHLPFTMMVAFEGLMISIVLGVFLAILMDVSENVKTVIYPVIVSSQTIPVIAIAPVFILWFGYGITSKVIVTVLMTFFPIVISTFDGLKSAKQDMQDLLKTYGANRYQIFFTLKLPSALPNFFSALKMSVPISIIGATIGEWLGSQCGLGYFSKRMMTQLDGPGIFAPIVILSFFAMFFVYIVDKFEKKFITWRNKI